MTLPVGINRIPVYLLTTDYRETALTAIRIVRKQRLVIIGRIMRVISTDIKSDSGMILQSDIVHTGLNIFVYIACLVIAGSQAITILVRSETAGISDIEMVLIIQIILECSPKIVVPILHPQLLVLPDIIYLIFQCMLRIEIHIFHLFYIIGSIHDIKSHFRRR